MTTGNTAFSIEIQEIQAVLLLADLADLTDLAERDITLVSEAGAAPAKGYIY